MKFKLHFWMLASLSCVLVGILFFRGLGGAFILDDLPTVSENPNVQVTSLEVGALGQAAYSFSAGSGSRALPMLTFAMDHWRAGLDPAAFKTTNILIHVLTTLALAGFFRLLLSMAGCAQKRITYSAPALALVWAIHPLQVSAVLYIVQRMQTMATLFLVLALWAYLKMRQAQLQEVRSRNYGVLTGLGWVLALACKEDAVLLPAYTLALELTVLQFRAGDPKLGHALKRGYFTLAVLAAAVFLLLVVPHYWRSDDYPHRNFSSFERLLTEGRVLALYLWQIIVPLPGHMPFYYDDIVPSTSLFHPWTTLPSLLLISGLLLLSWHLRTRRPLFALGVLLFFLGHFISSNVIGLELAFEHRNHFPLIGAILAIGDLVAATCVRLQLGTRSVCAVAFAILATLSTSTSIRSQEWGSPLGFARYSAIVAPASERALGSLCSTAFDLSGGDVASPLFKEAFASCEKGAALTIGASALTSLVIMKTINGTVRQADWDRLSDRLRHATMTIDTIGVASHLARYSNRDDRIAPKNVAHVIDIVSQRVGFRPEEYAGYGYYAMQKGLDSDAYRYFTLAVTTSPPHSPLAQALVADLRSNGKEDWAGKLEAQARILGSTQSAANH